MADYINTMLFGIYPYIALVVLLVGTIVRYDVDPYSWRSGSSQLLRRKQLVIGSICFHTGVLVILLGHVVGLLTPIFIFEAFGISHGAKQVLAVVVGGIAGVLALFGATLLAHRRLYDARIRANSTFSDNMIIILLWIQLVLGLMTIPISLQHLDGSEMVKFMSWAQGIFTFNSEASSYVQGASIIFKLHLLLGMTILLLFPFTRLVHMLSVPIWFMLRPGYQIVRGRQKQQAVSPRRRARRETPPEAPAE
ncbi:respiratory nitrate reductase subunit gamma [Rhodobacteraceae bacterium RKSG542]|uniref:respiratory nitrate reductase subunit gamma n=1 Tax=Pseudovibrio flavus TaxID=2529854 RepID=UPI0012BC408F|nr:respiratory nitrate reductase subunit gamma [Pseudovibrio flavus]MTI15779.1 respiratory nitrate reductase subunit gamma [Pseudovibrio flavus]